MRSILKSSLNRAILLSFIIALFNSTALAVKVSREIANLDYLYDDADIRGIVQLRLGDSVHIAPAVPNSPELIKEVAKAAVEEARGGRASLIPVNLSGNHWSAMAIRLKKNGDLVVFYNDSNGSAIGDANSESGQFVEAIRQIEPKVQILDLQVHQQNDATSCGAFVVENLITFAELDQANLTEEAVKQLLARINDAKAIRAKHGKMNIAQSRKFISSIKQPLGRHIVVTKGISQEAAEKIMDYVFNDERLTTRLSGDPVVVKAVAEVNLGGKLIKDDSQNYGLILSLNTLYPDMMKEIDDLIKMANSF